MSKAWVVQQVCDASSRRLKRAGWRRRACGAEGLSQSEVARRVEVQRQSVNRWARELEQSRMRRLRQAGHTGRPAKLNRTQLHELERHAQAWRGEPLGYQGGYADPRRRLAEVRDKCI
jgi:transposase